MKMSLKSFLFFVFPLCLLIFVQAEKGRLESVKHKSVHVAENSDIASSVNDDCISDSAIDNDEDDSSESIMRLLSHSYFTSFVSIPLQLSSTEVVHLTREISYRDHSPSFLSVYRI